MRFPQLSMLLITLEVFVFFGGTSDMRSFIWYTKGENMAGVCVCVSNLHFILPVSLDEF